MRVASNATWIIRAVLLAGALPICASSAEPAQPVVESWAPPRISSAQFESHPAFDPWNGDFYFVRSSPEFKGWRILVSRCTSSGWSEPVSPSFAGDGPLFSPSGKSLLFARDTKAPLSGELFVWRRAGTERWPPPCPN